jgi:hypothetical protein
MNQQIESDSRGRFVVLFHRFPADHQREDHWDLMLEEESKLMTWALSEMPKPGKSIPAVALTDHRKSYLDYQGQVSRDRGSVKRVLSGIFCLKPDSDRKQAVLEFDGGRMGIEFRAHGDALLIDRQCQAIGHVCIPFIGPPLRTGSRNVPYDAPAARRGRACPARSSVSRPERRALWVVLRRAG